MKIMQVKKWFMTAFVGVIALCSLATVPFAKTGPITLPGDALVNSIKAYANEVIGKFLGAEGSQLVLQQERILPEAAKAWWLPKQNYNRIMPESQLTGITGSVGLPQPISKISGVLIRTDRASINEIVQSKQYRGSG